MVIRLVVISLYCSALLVYVLLSPLSIKLLTSTAFVSPSEPFGDLNEGVTMSESICDHGRIRMQRDTFTLINTCNVTKRNLLCEEEKR